MYLQFREHIMNFFIHSFDDFDKAWARLPANVRGSRRMIFWHGRGGEHSHEVSMWDHSRTSTDSSFCLLVRVIVVVMDWGRVIVSEYG